MRLSRTPSRAATTSTRRRTRPHSKCCYQLHLTLLWITDIGTFTCAVADRLALTVLGRKTSGVDEARARHNCRPATRETAYDLSPLLSCNQGSTDREGGDFRPGNSCGFRIAGLAEVKRIGRHEALSCNPSTSARAWPDAPGLRAALGLVSRVTPVHTAKRNCTRDEGRSFEFGNQVLISSHRKLLWSKATVMNVAEKSEQDFDRYD